MWSFLSSSEVLAGSFDMWLLRLLPDKRRGQLDVELHELATEVQVVA